MLSSNPTPLGTAKRNGPTLARFEIPAVSRRGTSWLGDRRVRAVPAAAWVFVLLLACGDGAPERGVRVVLITLDTLRLDSFADESGSMRRARAYASRGRVFVNHYAATPNTQPTHASLLTGLHPWEHGVTRNGIALAAPHRTVPEVLSRQGFETRAVVASFPLAERFGFARGFDAFDAAFTRELGGPTWQGERVDRRRFYALAGEVAGRAAAQLDAATASRQMFWFHFFDPHEPYGDSGRPVVSISSLVDLMGRRSPLLPAALARARRAYERDNASLDRALGRLFDRLEHDARRFETHVVVVSDHGESFGESGVLGHGHHVAPEQIRVPLFIVSPRVSPGVTDSAAGSVDVASTLLDLAGSREPIGSGRSLVAARDGGERVAFGMSRTVEKPYRYIGTDGVEVEIASPRFYAARGDSMVVGTGAGRDPGEPGSVWRDAFGRFSRMLAESPSVEVNADTRDALEKLGYAQ